MGGKSQMLDIAASGWRHLRAKKTATGELKMESAIDVQSSQSKRVQCVCTWLECGSLVVSRPCFVEELVEENETWNADFYRMSWAMEVDRSFLVAQSMEQWRNAPQAEHS